VRYFVGHGRSPACSKTSDRRALSSGKWTPARALLPLDHYQLLDPVDDDAGLPAREGREGGAGHHLDAIDEPLAGSRQAGRVQVGFHQI